MLEFLSILGTGAGALLAIAATMYCVARILVVLWKANPRRFDEVVFAVGIFVAFLGCSLFVGLLVLGY